MSGRLDSLPGSGGVTLVMAPRSFALPSQHSCNLPWCSCEGNGSGRLPPCFSVKSSLCGCLRWVGPGRALQGCQSVFSLATLALHYEDSCLMCGCWAHAIENVLSVLSYLSSHASACGFLEAYWLWRPKPTFQLLGDSALQGQGCHCGTMSL